jgi:hypothetical protein
MNDEEGLLHELWEDTEDGGHGFTLCFAGPRGDSARSALPAEAKLVWTVWARSHFEAMTRYYERQGWGAYTTDHPGDFEPYPAEWLQELRQFLASSAPRESEAHS